MADEKKPTTSEPKSGRGAPAGKGGPPPAKPGKSGRPVQPLAPGRSRGGEKTEPPPPPTKGPGRGVKTPGTPAGR